MRWDKFSGNRRKETRPESPVDQGNALLKAQQKMHKTDNRPSEAIIREQRDAWPDRQS